MRNTIIGFFHHLSLREYVLICIKIVLTILFIRILETIFYTYATGDLLLHIKNNLLGFCYDCHYFSIIAIALLWPVAKMLSLAPKTTATFIKVVVIIISLCAICLVTFASQAGFPLDRALFIYTFDEIVETVSTTNSTTWWQYLCIVAATVSYLIIAKIKISANKNMLTIFAIFIISCAVVRISSYDNSPKNLHFNEQCNKIGYLAKSVRDGMGKQYNTGDIEQFTKQFQSFFNDVEFIDIKSPFLHKATSSNVLEPYFKLKEDKPNIVLVICEGLARDNSGVNSRYASATPFLDSLAENALCWDNCLSVSQRTFGVLPALFGALPFGYGGFMEMKKNAPDFHSLPKILKANEYQFNFFYGGWCGFDNTNTFVEMNGALDPCFSENYPDSTMRNWWGMLDKYLFTEALKTINFTSGTPRLDVYLTITSHGPWEYPDKDKFIKKYKANSLAQQKTENPDTEAAASYLYVDEAIKQLINDYSKQEGFDNTIFIITGDHNFNAWTDIIERYHVPFVIWSPMLTSHQHFHALVSHRDFTPTIISLLKDKYAINSPDEVAWINHELDTASSFRCTTFIPQSDPSRNMISMVYNDNFIYNNQNYKITFDGKALHLDDDNSISPIQLFSIYKNIDRHVCMNDCLIKPYQHNFVNNVLRKKKYATSTNAIFKNIIDIPLYDNTKSMDLDLSFRIKLNEQNDSCLINLVFEVKNSADKSLSYEYYPVSIQYNTWKTFILKEKLKSIDGLYRTGNKLIVYLWNPKGIEYRLSKLNIELNELH